MGRMQSGHREDDEGRDPSERRQNRLMAFVIGFILAGTLAEVAEKIQHYFWMKERGVGFWEFAPWDLHWEYFIGTGIYLDLVTLGCWLFAWLCFHRMMRGE